MDLSPYVDELQEHLVIAASAGGDDVQEAARRLSSALDSATRLVLLDALSTAAGEISRELVPGSVDVRLRGRDPEFVVERPVLPVTDPASPPAAPIRAAPDAIAVITPAAPQPAPDAEPGPAGPVDEGSASRTTLRLPDSLKLKLEQAATREGISLNSWIVRSLAAAVDAPPRAAPHPAQRSSNFSGWAR